MQEPKPKHDLAFQGQHQVAIPIDRLWELLNTPEILAQCIRRCEAVERHSDSQFSACFRARVGPVKKDFNARLEIRDARPPHQYTLDSWMDAGMAGEFEGEARVKLESLDPQTTRVEYAAVVIAGGWLGQLGSRLLRGTAEKYMSHFFSELEALATRESDQVGDR